MTETVKSVLSQWEHFMMRLEAKVISVFMLSWFCFSIFVGDDNRVILSMTDGYDSDYINASYIKVSCYMIFLHNF